MTRLLDEGRRAKRRASRPLPGKPSAPLLGTDCRPTPIGLTYIEALARHGATQGFIASRLGLTAKALKKLLADEHDTPTRLAWEAGHAELETEVAQLLLAAGRDGNVVSLIFFSKAKLGWQESAPPPASNMIQLVLPRPLSADEYADRLRERRELEATFLPPDMPALPAPEPDPIVEDTATAEVLNQEVEFQLSLQRRGAGL